MYFLLGNFSDPTIALLQWAFEQQLTNLTILTVDTGWAAESWAERLDLGSQFANRLGFATVRLIAPITFPALVRDRQQFPSPKYAWCAGMLKGLTIHDYLDRVDPQGESTIVLPHRRYASRIMTYASEWVEASDVHGGRRLWHPLLELSPQEFERLLQASQIPRVQHRSLECDPCIYSTSADLKRVAPIRRQALAILEQDIGQSSGLCFTDQSVELTLPDGEAFTGGCGSPWGCGQ